MIKDFNNFVNEDRVFPEKLKSDVIDIKKLERCAFSIETLCNGEYGQVFFNPSENHVFVCIGDSNPFGDQFESYLKDAIKKDYMKTKDEDIKITIENEALPNTEATGWFVFDDDVFTPYHG